MDGDILIFCNCRVQRLIGRCTDRKKLIMELMMEDSGRVDSIVDKVTGLIKSESLEEAFDVMDAYAKEFGADEDDNGDDDKKSVRSDEYWGIDDITNKQ